MVDYENNKPYRFVIDDIECVVELENFSEEVIDKFNRLQFEEYQRKGRQANRSVMFKVA